MSSMEDIIEIQEQLSGAMGQIYTNFKKDGSDRKNSDYIQRRLETLDQHWNEFHNNHINLMSIGDKSHVYFSSNQYEQVKEKYNKIREHIKAYQPLGQQRLVLQPPTFTPTPGPKVETKATSSKTEDMLKKQVSNFKAFRRTVVNIDLDTTSEKWEFEDLLRTLQARWSAIDTLHWELDSELDSSNQEYERQFSMYEKQYEDVKKSINRKMWSVAHRDKSTPTMEIPTFNGSYSQWISFKDLFTETVHSNPSLSNAQKMQFLKGKVRGEAERLIQHLQISSDNYSICWDILNHRFDNKKLIFTSHVNTLINIPVMQQQTVNHIKRLHDTTQECLNAIKNLGVDTRSWDPLIVHILSQKLDTDTFNDYMQSLKQPRELPKLTEFLDFLEIRFTTLESSRRKQENPTQKSNIMNQVSSPKYQNQHSYQKPSYYQQSHPADPRMATPQASNYKNYHVASSKPSCKFCYICDFCNTNDHGIYFCEKFRDLSNYMKRKTVTQLNLCPNCLYNHQGKPCVSDKRCRKCNKEHNTILHEAFTSSNPTPVATNPPFEPIQQLKSNTHVSLQNDPSEILLATAMIYIQGADGSHHIMRALLDQGSQTSLITENAAQLLKIPRQRCKGVISGIGAKESNCNGLISIKCASLVSDFTFETGALIIKNLIKCLPNQTFQKPNWSYLDHIKLADPKFYESRPVDILLGADVYSNILMDGICRVNSTLPTAQQTQLGWILSGNVKTFHCNVVLHNIEKTQKFWEIEDITETSDLSAENQEYVKFYQSSTSRQDDGRYEVRTPLKFNFEEKIGELKSKAIAQFNQLERKFQTQAEIKKDYTIFINEYLSLGHMTLVTSNGNTKPDCFLPHHGVHRDVPRTTKLQVVFNASVRMSTGFSLNDIMSRGPNLQLDLQSLIIKWRQYRFTFTANIEKMFRQIWIHPVNQELHNMIDLLQSGGFNLRKWKSNLPELLRGDQSQSKQENFDYKEAESTKTLGLQWDREDDQFIFQSRLQLSNSKPASIPPDCWQYIKSKENPAHCASRGLTTSQLKDHSLWWQGPAWLPSYEPTSTTNQLNYFTNQEVKKRKQVNVTQLSPENEIIKSTLNKHSSLTKAVRVLAWVLRLDRKHKENFLIIQERKSNQENTISSSDQQEGQSNRLNKPSSKKKQTFRLTTMAISLLLFFMTFVQSSQSALYNITPLQNNNSLYFESITNMHLIRDDWRLVVYYDTYPYKQGNTALTKYIKYLDSTCSRLKEHSHCEGIVLQLRHGFEELKHYNNILINNHAAGSRIRRRRGLINGVGYIANSLFGVLDDRFADKYESDIKNIRENEKHLAALWKNQTSVVEAEFNLLKRTEDIMDKHHKTINQKFNSIENSLSEIKSGFQNISVLTDFITSSMIANSILFNLRSIQNTLLDTVTNIYNGKFNFHILTPDQLRHELNVISGQLPKDLSSPIDNWDISEIYNLLQVHAKMSQQYLIIEIKIPLISRDKYEISRLIPIPYQINNKMTSIVPIADFAGINLKKDTYIPLTESDLQSCIQQNADLILCHLKIPIYHIKDDHSLCKILPKSRTCVTVISSCQDSWKELKKLNNYFYFCCDRCQLKLLCEDQITAVQLTNAGIFTTNQGCIIKSPEFSVYAHKQEMSKINISSNIDTPEISPINYIINISMPTSTALNTSDNELFDHRKQLQEIKEKLELMKQSEPLSESMTYHNIHHYTAMYTLIGVLLLAAVIIMSRRLRRYHQRPAAAATAAATAPQLAAHVSSDEFVQCSVESELSELPKASARVLRQSRGTSPVLRSVFTLPDA